MRAAFLSIVRKGSFYNCAVLVEIYDRPPVFAVTKDILSQTTFMGMKRELSVSQTTGDN